MAQKLAVSYFIHNFAEMENLISSPHSNKSIKNQNERYKNRFCCNVVRFQ
jgi:hypothetical protein